MPEGSTDDLADMMRGLLAERFQLRTHREQRDFDVYALERSKNGPSLIPSPDDTPANGTFTVGSSSDGNAIAADLGNGASLSFANSKFEARRVTMTALGDTLGRFLDRPIVDRTGLTGGYEFTLRYSNQPNPADDTPSLFTALEEQLGLKLMPDRAPLQVLVVDRIERPTED